MMYDVIGTAETNIDSFDEVGIPGYVFHSTCRKSFHSRKSGGLGVFIKDTFSNMSLKLRKNVKISCGLDCVNPSFVLIMTYI